MNEIDFIITTFERYDLLDKLLLSIKKYYPFASVSIYDDSINRKELLHTHQLLRIITSDIKDNGLSFARNQLISFTENKYILLLEDDFEFTDNTQIEKMLDILKNTDTDIIGGMCYDECEQHFEHDLKIEDGVLYEVENKNEYKELNGVKYKSCDVVLNFALFKREVFDKVLWDENLKMCEHNDFYLMAKEKGIKVAYTPDVAIRHKKQNTPEYMKYRMREDEFITKMMNKWGINKIIKSNNRAILLENGLIRKVRNYVK